MPDTALLTPAKYDEDFYAWALEQAGSLRSLAGKRRNPPLDLVNLAEEVEELAKSVRNLCRRQIRRVIEHLLRLEFSPASAPRHQWRASIIDARQELKDNLTSSLRRELEMDFAQLSLDARRRAVEALVGHGEKAAAGKLPALPSYDLDRVLDEDWFPAEHRIGGE